MEPYIGEIRAFAGTFAPQGWALCDGTIIPIVENETLFTLIGTVYGGDGQSTFALPDLRGRAIVSQGKSIAGTTYPIGSAGGAEKVAINVNEMPVHSHSLMVSTNQGTVAKPEGNFLAAAVEATTNASPQQVRMYIAPYSVGFVAKALAPSILPYGGSQKHENRSPYISINYIIAIYGLYPQIV